MILRQILCSSASCWVIVILLQLLHAGASTAGASTAGSIDIYSNYDIYDNDGPLFPPQPFETSSSICSTEASDIDYGDDEETTAKGDELMGVKPNMSRFLPALIKSSNAPLQRVVGLYLGMLIVKKISDTLHRFLNRDGTSNDPLSKAESKAIMDITTENIKIVKQDVREIDLKLEGMAQRLEDDNDFGSVAYRLRQFKDAIGDLNQACEENRAQLEDINVLIGNLRREVTTSVDAQIKESKDALLEDLKTQIPEAKDLQTSMFYMAELDRECKENKDQINNVHELVAEIKEVIDDESAAQTRVDQKASESQTELRLSLEHIEQKVIPEAVSAHDDLIKVKLQQYTGELRSMVSQLIAQVNSMQQQQVQRRVPPPTNETETATKRLHTTQRPQQQQQLKQQRQKAKTGGSTGRPKQSTQSSKQKKTK